MVESPLKKSLPPDAQLFFVRAVWGALFGSIFIYTFVAISIAQSREPFAIDLNQITPTSPLEQTLSAVAISCILFALFVPRFLAKRTAFVLTPKSSESDLLKPVFVPFIVRLAFLEACTLTGFVFAIVRHNANPMFPFAFMSVVGYLMSFPTWQSIRALLLPKRGPEIISEGRSGPQGN